MKNLHLQWAHATQLYRIIRTEEKYIVIDRWTPCWPLSPL